MLGLVWCDTLCPLNNRQIFKKNLYRLLSNLILLSFELPLFVFVETILMIIKFWFWIKLILVIKSTLIIASFVLFLIRQKRNNIRLFRGIDVCSHGFYKYGQTDRKNCSKEFVQGFDFNPEKLLWKHKLLKIWGDYSADQNIRSATTLWKPATKVIVLFITKIKRFTVSSIKEQEKRNERAFKMF